jgi:hypothetical protein
MLKLIAAAALSLAMQGPEDWHDFGVDRDGVRVSVNLASIESGTDGPEAMVRLRYPHPIARNATQVDLRGVFNCQTRRVQRRMLNELSATGEITVRSDNGQAMDPITAAAGTPMGRVLDLVCATATG